AAPTAAPVPEPEAATAPPADTPEAPAAAEPAAVAQAEAQAAPVAPLPKGTKEGQIVFAWPVNCDVGRDCFIQQYVDHDAGDGYSDYRCGPLSYDTHKGTDIRIPGI